MAIETESSLASQYPPISRASSLSMGPDERREKRQSQPQETSKQQERPKIKITETPIWYFEGGSGTEYRIEITTRTTHPRITSHNYPIIRRKSVKQVVEVLADEFRNNHLLKGHSLIDCDFEYVKLVQQENPREREQILRSLEKELSN